MEAGTFDKLGHSALMHAACACSADAVTALLRHAGAEAARLQAKDDMGRTALMQMLLLPLGIANQRRGSLLMQSSSPRDAEAQAQAQAEADKAAHASARRKSIAIATEKARRRPGAAWLLPPPIGGIGPRLAPALVDSFPSEP